MQLILIILTALAPVAVALYYIYKKDDAQPEPAKWLTRAFVFGVISVFISFLISIPTSFLFGLELNNETYNSILEAITDSFLLAAIPEESAKFIMFWLLLRKNPFFDEQFDGILYSVCVSMGFAALENIGYLASGTVDGSWLDIGISRAMFSIPGHFFFAVLMGYYYSIYHWNIERTIKNKLLILAAPILAHGVFDAIIMSMQVNSIIAIPCVVLFMIFFNMLRKKSKNKIESLMNK